MADMPDTTTDSNASRDEDTGEPESDDAAGYDVPGDRSRTPRRPADPSTSAGTPGSSRPGSRTRPTAAGSR